MENLKWSLLVQISWYRFKFTREDFTDSSLGIVRRLDQHYKTLTKQFGFKMLPPEDMVNNLGYNSLFQKQYVKAAALFEMNVANYPESGNVYDSYADLLVAKKDTAKAIANYQKALSIGNSEETKQKLDRLQGKTAPPPTAKELEKYVATNKSAYESYTLPLSG